MARPTPNALARCPASDRHAHGDEWNSRPGQGGGLRCAARTVRGLTLRQGGGDTVDLVPLADGKREGRLYRERGATLMGVVDAYTRVWSRCCGARRVRLRAASRLVDEVRDALAPIHARRTAARRSGSGVAKVEDEDFSLPPARRPTRRTYPDVAPRSRFLKPLRCGRRYPACNFRVRKRPLGSRHGCASTRRPSASSCRPRRAWGIRAGTSSGSAERRGSG